MKQIILNVSEGIKKIDIQTSEPRTKTYTQLILDELLDDTVIFDINGSGKLELRKLTPAEFLGQMTKIVLEYGHDEEVAHLRMDELICRVLREQGFDAGVRVFDQQSKHYA